MNYAELHRRSITERDAFWREQATRIDWATPPGDGHEAICDASQPPFARWFPGATTNLCHNAVDRHVGPRGDQPALTYVSTETNQERTWTFRELHQEVQTMAAILQQLGVGRGDRVLLYMPMVPEAIFAMLATVRLGAIHSVVFGGFASASLATRIDDARPKVIVTADAGSRGGKVVAYKPLLDDALRLATHSVDHVLLVDRGLAPAERQATRDVDYLPLHEQHRQAHVGCTWVDSTHPSYILYTSGTTGKPKGVQRDTGGYAVALATSMDLIYQGKPGETFFCTSDIGWVVGHSYIVYGPLVAGMRTVVYEGLPTCPDAAVWWSLVEKYQATVMFSAPTAIRVLKKQDPECLKRHDLSSLKHLFLAGEPLDEPTARWISDAIGKPIIDNYWQTETGWPILSVAHGVEPGFPTRFGSPGVPMPGFDVQLLDDSTGQPITTPDTKGVVTISHPLPPGCLQTVWGDDARFAKTYWSSFPQRQPMAYNTFDWGIRDADGYYFILGRTDDVINVAGHRLGTREIEEAVSGHSAVAEVAVVGVADSLKGQVPVAFAVLRDASRAATPELAQALQAEIFKTVDQHLGAVGRPSRVVFVNVLPKTRSGKLLRRAIQAVCEGRDTGDLTTIEDPTALAQLKERWGG
ncbi:propionate--CoA ligase [Aquabacterium lacunae]|nr:propionate--CoA ligase [Aquabacterium lacunae]